MKILQINSVYGVGSTGKIVKDIHKKLLFKGFDSYVMYGRGKTVDSDQVIKISSNFDNYCHGLLSRLLDLHGFGSKASTIDLIKQIDLINPDVIHLHNIHGYYINIQIIFDYVKSKNKRVIWTLHDCWSFTGHCAHFDSVGCERWMIGCGSCPQRETYPASVLIDNSAYNFIKKQEIFTGVNNLTIITPSNWLANLVKKSFLKDYPINVINNGIDTDIFTKRNSEFRNKYNLHNKFIILGVASPWTEKKGFLDFIKLSSMIDSSQHIVMVGVTDKQISQLPSNILGISRTNNAIELAEIYSSADVFFNPTHEDNYPTVNLEAQCCGTYVITYDVGGSPETISYECGIIVSNGDFDSILNIINYLKLNVPLVSVKREKFSRERFTNEVLELYNVNNNY